MSRRTAGSGAGSRWSPDQALGAFAVVLALAVAGPAAAAPRLALGVLAGAQQPGAQLADYQWSTDPRFGWGLQAIAGGPGFHRRFGAGLRFWTSATEQRLGVPEAPSLAVRTQSLEVVGRGRIAAIASTELSVIGTAGRLRLSYRPDRVTIATGGTPVTVDLDAIGEWIGGAGLALHQPVAGSWNVGLEVERRVFRLDAAHREGAAVVTGRQTFGDWSARLELARLVGRH